MRRTSRLPLPELRKALSNRPRSPVLAIADIASASRRNGTEMRSTASQVASDASRVAHSPASSTSSRRGSIRRPSKATIATRIADTAVAVARKPLKRKLNPDTPTNHADISRFDRSTEHRPASLGEVSGNDEGDESLQKEGRPGAESVSTITFLP